MPSIDPRGQYRVHALDRSNGKRASIRFPVKASSLKVAERFAVKMVPVLLPGWDGGGNIWVRKANLT